MFLTIILLYIILFICIFITNKNKPKKLIKEFIGYKDNNNNHLKNNNCNSNQNTNSNGELKSNVWQIPGPISLPLIGTKWIFYWKYKISKIHEAYEDMHKKYGDILLEVTSNGIPIVSLYNRQDIEKVLRYPSRYPFRPPTEIIAFYRMTRPDRYLNVGLVNAQGAEWYHLRTKLTPNITSRKVLNAFIPSLNDICDDLIELIKFKRDQNNMIENFQDIANSFGLEAVCCLILGRRMGYLAKSNNIDSKFKELAYAVNKIFTLNRDAYYGNGLWKYFPTKIYRDFVYYEEKVYNIISEIVDKALNEEQLEYKDNEVNSIFVSILQTEGLDIREKKSGIIDFITAGIDTMAHTMSFFFHHISQNKNAQQKIFKEFANVNEQITQENLSSGSYTRACIQESYRLTPTAMCIARLLEEDYNLSGYNLKSGTFVLCQTMRSCHENANFENAKEFIPERWLISGTKNDDDGGTRLVSGGLSTSLVVPFGIGRRTCPGKNFVELNMALCVIKLIKAFQIEYISELDTQFEFLLAPKTPVQIRFSDRF